jgi:hypothetical protein
MANGHGGYRAPANPAPVSGPAQLAERTDGGPSQPIRRLPDAGYGESKEFEAQQAAAPLAESPPATVDASGIVPLDAPTARPNEPVTAGGVTGVEPMVPDEADSEQLRSYIPVLKDMASREGSTRATRQFVRQLETRLHNQGM